MLPFHEVTENYQSDGDGPQTVQRWYTFRVHLAEPVTVYVTVLLRQTELRKSVLQMLMRIPQIPRCRPLFYAGNRARFLQSRPNRTSCDTDLGSHGLGAAARLNRITVL